MESNDVNIHLVQLNSKTCLQFDFTEHLSEEIATKAIKQWKAEVEKLQPRNSKIDLIYNCLSMNITWIISGNIFILGAAGLVNQTIPTGASLI